MDSAEDVLQLALQVSKASTRTRSGLEDFKAAEALLLKVRPYVRSFDSAEFMNGLANREVCVAMSWSSDYALSHGPGDGRSGVDRPPGLSPCRKEGANQTFSSLLIPEGAPHPQAALSNSSISSSAPR